MTTNLSTKHLRAFSALAQERNFTRAAERCHLSQPAFSALMNGLEDLAGARLFHRTTRAVELTKEGQVFEATVARLLEDFEDAFGELRAHAQLRKGRVTIAALPTVAGGELPADIARFLAQYPGIDVVLRDLTADSCLDVVRSRQADFALSAAVEPGPDLISEPLLRDRFHLVCRDDHPLAKRRHLKMKDIMELPQIRFEQTSSIRQHVDAAFYPAQPVTAFQVNQLVTAAGLVGAGLGVTLVPTLALFQFRMSGLVSIPVDLPLKDRELCLIRQRDSSDSVAVKAFVSVLRESLRPTSTSTRMNRPLGTDKSRF
ncbi:MAG: LysR substrate-binding domain-containing protein [Burkholderiaceae bacterium]